MQRLRDFIMDCFLACGLIGFLIGLALPVVGVIWTLARWLT